MIPTLGNPLPFAAASLRVPLAPARRGADSRPLLRNHHPERQVDPFPHRLFRLRNLVEPFLLRASLHDEEASVREVDARLQFFPFPVFELEHPGPAETDRGNDGVLSELGFVIGVPGDAVLAGAVTVQKYAVEGDAARQLNGPLDLQDGRGPRLSIDLVCARPRS